MLREDCPATHPKPTALAQGPGAWGLGRRLEFHAPACTDPFPAQAPCPRPYLVAVSAYVHFYDPSRHCVDVYEPGFRRREKDELLVAGLSSADSMRLRVGFLIG